MSHNPRSSDPKPYADRDTKEDHGHPFRIIMASTSASHGHPDTDLFGASGHGKNQRAA
jgi:hypothetical protein